MLGNLFYQLSLKNRVQKLYRDWANTYDQEINPSLELEKETVIKLIEASPGDIILDLGCGTGRYTKLFSESGANLVGIDFSEEMLKIARLKIKDAQFIKWDITRKLPFPDKSFNKIICSLVISHIKNIYPVIMEMKRVLKEDGFIIITTIHPKVDFSDFDLLQYDFCLTRYNCSIYHDFLVFENIFSRAKLNIREKLELYINESIKHCFTKNSFDIINGRPQGLIYKISVIS